MLEKRVNSDGKRVNSDGNMRCWWEFVASYLRQEPSVRSERSAGKKSSSTYKLVLSPYMFFVYDVAVYFIVQGIT